MKKFKENGRITSAFKRHLKKYKRFHSRLPAYCEVPDFGEGVLIKPAPKRRKRSNF